MIKDYKDITRREFLYRFFDLRNVLEPVEYRLTDKEIRLLTEVLLLPEQYKYSRFGTRAKKYLSRKLKEEGWDLSPQGLSTLLKHLESKGMIYKEDGERMLHKNLLALIDKRRVNFSLSFTFSIKDEHS